MSQAILTDVYDEIAAANEVFMTAFRQGDAAGLANLYTEDWQLLPPNGDFVTGYQELEGFWAAAMNMGFKEAKLEIVEVDPCADTAIEVSKFTMLGEAGQVLDEGKYIVIWKHLDGKWLLHRDIFNSSMPPPG